MIRNGAAVFAGSTATNMSKRLRSVTKKIQRCLVNESDRLHRNQQLLVSAQLRTCPAGRRKIPNLWVANTDLTVAY